jgi:hypothetical protein
MLGFGPPLPQNKSTKVLPSGPPLWFIYMKAQLWAKHMVKSVFILGMSSGTLCKLGENKRKSKIKINRLGKRKLVFFFEHCSKCFHVN